MTTTLWEREQKFVKVMAKLVQRGIGVDLDFVKSKIPICETNLARLEESLQINPASPKDLERLLITRMGLPVLKRNKETNRISFNAKIMEKYDALLLELESPIARNILDYRGWQKTYTSFYKPYLTFVDEFGRIHPGYRLHGTKTGRTSCTNPNLQQIPRTSFKPWNGDIKQAFIPTPGFRLWDVDYNSLEFRLMAAYAEEERLIQTFNTRGLKIFDVMSADLGWIKDRTKKFTYMTSYGAGDDKIAYDIDITKDEARKMRLQFYKTYPGLQRKTKEAEAVARELGYLTLWTGRKRHFTGEDKEHLYKAFNSVIQGGGFEIVKSAMIRLDEQVTDDNCRMVLQVHDSVVFEIKEGMEDLYLPRISDTMFVDKEVFGVEFPVAYDLWGAH